MNKKKPVNQHKLRHFTIRSQFLQYDQMKLCLTAILSYVVIAHVFLQFAHIHPNASPIWPLSGMSIGFLVLYGLRNWPVVFVGSLTANLITNISFNSDFSLTVNVMVASGIAFANSLEALSGAWFIVTFTHGKNCLNHSFEIFLFVLFCVFLPPLLSTGGGVLTLIIAGYAQWDQAGRIMLTWYTANAFGVLFFTPFLFTFSRPIEIQWSMLKVIELLILFSLLVLIGQSISGIYFSAFMQGWPKSYMVIPLLLWMGFRFNYHGVMAAILLLSTIAMTGTMRGYQAFPAATPDLALLQLQLFLGIVTIMSISVVSILTELHHINEILEQHVELRTRSINTLLEEKNSLMATIAHDLQSPILGLQNIIRLRNSPKAHITSDNWEVIFAEMENTCTNMYQLINSNLTSMHTLSSSEHNSSTRENINQLLKQCIPPNLIAANEKRIKIKDLIPAESAWCMIDSEYLPYIAETLISNAIKFSPSKSTIYVSSLLLAKHFCFVVTNREADITHFGSDSSLIKLYRLRKKPADPQLFGIELNNIQKLLSSIKGEIRCQRVKKNWSEFTLTLPVTDSYQ